MPVYLESSSNSENTVIGFFGGEAFQSQHNRFGLLRYQVIDPIQTLSARKVYTQEWMRSTA